MALWTVLLPPLRHFEPDERPRALRRAAAEPLDAWELAGMALVLLAVTAATRYGLADASIPSRLLAILWNIAVALPLLAAGMLPLHLRRLRRGLRSQLRGRGQG